MKENTVLLVEDEPLIAVMVSDCLREHGFAVAVAENADAAWTLIAGGNGFDILVTDIKMPGQLSGWDLARKARGRIPDLMVVYTTGHGENDWRFEGVPMSLLAAKPFDPDHLAKQILDMANGWRRQHRSLTALSA